MSCKKDPPITGNCGNCDGCTPVGSPSGITSGWELIADGRSFFRPCFNPENANEFLFMTGENSNDTLWVHDLVTSSSVKILTGYNIVSRPQWGKSGWIIMALSDNNIWKMKSNGDSLIQLSFNSYCYQPGWNYDYSAVVYYRSVVINPTTAYTMTIDGQALDTIGDCYSASSAWNHPEYITTYSCYGVTICNPITGEITNVASKPDENVGCSGYSLFVSNDNVIWSCSYGLYTTDINTKQTQHVLQSCDAKLYSSPSYSSQSNKLLWQKLLRKPDSTRTALFHRSSIVIMNPDGTDEQEIQLP